MFTFEGTKRKSSLKVYLKVHNPQFYWKVNALPVTYNIVTKSDLGLADAYINEDFSVIDKNEGLLHMLMLLIVNSDLQSSASWIKKSEDEDLKTAQMRKISTLIEKARVKENHEVLDIGCGWGGFAIELVKQTGCKYTGITLAKEQKKYAESKVKEAGLQDRIRFLLCDYRELPDTYKCDRIISCGSIEHVGHEYYEEFFRCCESVLVEDGIFVLQILSNASNCSVDHVEKIGIHYYRTLRCWRENFLKNQSKILSLGFNQEFIRTWELYFDYCAAGFKTEMLDDYQVVFSRPGNMNVILGDP
ncbi:hypothetical protein L1987_79371 [Smallanthus sonchifolius]|uniref:Uncharacterized protein n=1 Tax=Smallanthus sonchifolius TaxID=185202 RepID=A0ACB8ZFK6_9ASTR|nr:hypothetical protein L1987_79371 [Smallanthus sonchifolius]